MKKFYATFMQKQAFKNHFVEFITDEMNFAHHAMHEHFGEKFMTVYSESVFLPQIEKYNLKRLCTIQIINHGAVPEYPSLSYVLIGVG